MIQTKFKQLKLIKKTEKKLLGWNFHGQLYSQGAEKNSFCYCSCCTCWQSLPEDLIRPFWLYYSVLILKALSLILRQAASAVILKCKLVAK